MVKMGVKGPSWGLAPGRLPGGERHLGRKLGGGIDTEEGRSGPIYAGVGRRAKGAGTCQEEETRAGRSRSCWPRRELQFVLQSKQEVRRMRW